MKNPRQTGDELKSFWRKDRRTLARETTNRSIWRSLSPCTGSGRRPFRESDPNRTRWWRRVSALLNRLNDLDVTPFPVTRQLYPAANKSLLLPPSLSLSSPLSLSLPVLSFCRDTSTLLRVTANSPARTNRRWNWREISSAARYSADHGFVIRSWGWRDIDPHGRSGSPVTHFV